MRDVVRNFFCIFSFLSILDTLSFVYRSCDYFGDSKHCTYLWYIFDDVVITFHLPLYVLFLFSLYTHVSYLLYAIYYFCFTLRCRDEFCLKCFRNTGCQSLLVMNFLLAKFFKSLCYDRFYCIQQMSISWVIYDFSYMFICLLWFCHGLPKGEIVRTYVNHVKNICQYFM